VIKHGHVVAVLVLKHRINKQALEIKRLYNSLVMLSGNVTLRSVHCGEAAILSACPERAQRVERETSLDISDQITARQ